METNRIQKLLLSEYKDLSDRVLIESPFAETTRNGCGIREVAIGLTSSKLIIATDIFQNNNEYRCPSDLDPSIESLELVSVYPLEYITLSVFSKRRRKTLKIRLINGRTTYYELGGMNRREIFWNLWCEHVQTLLSQKENGSSLSETTAASSSSASTLYVFSSDVDQEVKSDVDKRRKRCVCRLWKHYGDAGDIPPSWTRKDIYMGPAYNELGPNNYVPVPIRISKMNFKNFRNEFLFTPNPDISSAFYHKWSRNYFEKRKNKNCYCNGSFCDVSFNEEYSQKKHLEYGDCVNSLDSSSLTTKIKNKYTVQSIPKLSRFGCGVDEKCIAGLYLPLLKGNQPNLTGIGRPEMFVDPYKIIEDSIAIWEQNKYHHSYNLKKKLKHLRRYGFAASPHFLYALGPWSVPAGDKISIQSKRSLSSVNIRKVTVDVDVKLPISKRQLVTSVSMTSLEHGISSFEPTDRGQVLLFWTPDYWYRPRAAISAYRELHQHLAHLRDFQQTSNNKSYKKFFSRKNDTKYIFNSSNEKIIPCDKATCILNKIFLSRDGKKKKIKINMQEKAKSTIKLRNLLKMNLRICAWDLDSTTLAKQLTLIDRNLFLRIPVTEIQVLVYEKSSSNAPNIGALIAFSHRISCLVSSELLAISKLNMRTRILARFLNVASKCFSLGNFQSCRSILAGLQSPAIYRLRSTWAYLKIHHSTKYEMMSKLCKIFRNPRTKIYTKAWEKAEQCPPLIPYIGDIFIRILGLDRNSNSLFCECPERRKMESPIAVRENWDGGGTYLTEAGVEKINYQSSKIILTNKLNNPKPISMKNINFDSRRGIHSITTKNGIVKKLSSAVIKLRYGNYTPIKSRRQSIFWAARQLILARKYLDLWQTFVMTAKIIAESEIQKRSIDVKRRKIEDVTSWLLICQRHARGYDFSCHSLAWEFLLKARYREERENFIISRKLEPILNSN